VSGIRFRKKFGNVDKFSTELLPILSFPLNSEELLYEKIFRVSVKGHHLFKISFKIR